MLTNERGDTLIEVIFATAVLALIIVLSMSVMNSGTAQAQRAVEGTFVRQAIDSQTELLRYARDSYVDGNSGASTLWNAILAQRIPAAMNFSGLAATKCTPPNGQKAFWLQANGGSVALKTTFSPPTTFAAPGNGIWIEATPTTPGTNYVDFYIYACWEPPSGTVNSTTGTIVRLYVPV